MCCRLSAVLITATYLHAQHMQFLCFILFCLCSSPFTKMYVHYACNMIHIHDILVETAIKSHTAHYFQGQGYFTYLLM